MHNANAYRKDDLRFNKRSGWKKDLYIYIYIHLPEYKHGRVAYFRFTVPISETRCCCKNVYYFQRTFYSTIVGCITLYFFVSIQNNSTGYDCLNVCTYIYIYIAISGVWGRKKKNVNTYYTIEYGRWLRPLHVHNNSYPDHVSTYRRLFLQTIPTQR